MTSRIKAELPAVEAARNAFLNSNAPRYSEEYYRLLSAWDDARKHMESEGRIQMAEIMSAMR